MVALLVAEVGRALARHSLRYTLCCLVLVCLSDSDSRQLIRVFETFDEGKNERFSERATYIPSYRTLDIAVLFSVYDIN